MTAEAALRTVPLKEPLLQTAAAAFPDQTVIKTAAVAANRLESANGIYIGAIQDGKPHGKGTFTYTANPEGRKQYTGDFTQGLPHGQGRLESSNGDIYQGLFSNGEPHGEGELTTSMGERFKGPFVNGKMHGLFSYWDPNRCCYERWTPAYYENDIETFHCETCCTIL